MPKSTPRRPGKPGQNRDSRDGVFGHPESQVGPLPRVGLYARVSTPHEHTIGMQLRQDIQQDMAQLEMRLDKRISGLEAQIGELRERMTHPEELLEGLREAITGRAPAS